MAFGQFVVRGNFVVGAVVFIILTIVNFIVISKGSERVAEVAARFTLDAMPGKQMSIDADLRSGALEMEDGKRKRRDLERESQLFGAMDGAMKFVKGDAIAGIIITVVNIVGGLIIGVMQHNLSIGDAAKKYTLLTIGDGLVGMIPAILISTAAGIIVTRVGGEEEGSNLGKGLRHAADRVPARHRHRRRHAGGAGPGPRSPHRALRRSGRRGRHLGLHDAPQGEGGRPQPHPQRGRERRIHRHARPGARRGDVAFAHRAGAQASGKPGLRDVRADGDPHRAGGLRRAGAVRGLAPGQRPLPLRADPVHARRALRGAGRSLPRRARARQSQPSSRRLPDPDQRSAGGDGPGHPGPHPGERHGGAPGACSAWTPTRRSTPPRASRRRG